MFHLSAIPEQDFIKKRNTSCSDIAGKALLESLIHTSHPGHQQHHSRSIIPQEKHFNGDSQDETEKERTADCTQAEYSQKNMIFASEGDPYGAVLESEHHPGMIGGKGWAPKLLLECGEAISLNDTPKLQHLMWMLNEVSSPYGDFDQRLASCFLQGLFYRFTGNGVKYYNILCSSAEKSSSFSQRRRVFLKCQEALPYMTFGHVVANGALFEVLQREPKIHIVDISSSYSSQWPTFLENLAMQPGKAPQVRITLVTFSKDQSPELLMENAGSRLKKFARLMGIPFELKVFQQLELEKLHSSMLDLKNEEALAINCVQSLHLVPNYTTDCGSTSRDQFLSMLHSMNPKLVTMVETEENVRSSDFLTSYTDILRFYTTFFDSLEENFSRISSERLMLERTVTRSVISFLACDKSFNSLRKQQKSTQWCHDLTKSGFRAYALSSETIDDVEGLLKKYKEGWGYLQKEDGFLYLTWKEQCTVFASAWKPEI